ncbi:MAG: hypothetical protein II110_09035 [Treponema sp.]|nr:hypothetical protein [Treponema sp.]
MKKVLFLLFSFLNSFLFAETSYIYEPFNKGDVDVSSCLKDSGIEYSVENLSPLDDLPWVPDGGNNGKNSKITIRNCNTKEMYISIGYVKKGRGDLYYKNSRPKTVNIYFKDLKTSKTYELKDTPEAQRIVLSDTSSNLGVIELTFPEVYEGSKYKDLCINFLAAKRKIKDEKLYGAIPKINSNLQKKKCYVRILPLDVEKWRPEKTFRGCPIESEMLFKHTHCEDFVGGLGDVIGVKKLLFEKYIFPEFKKNGLSVQDISYYELEDYVFDVSFTVSSIKYCMSVWVYTEDCLLISLFMK